MLMEIDLLHAGGSSGGETDIDSEIEDEIHKILSNIKYNEVDYESLSEIEELRSMAIDKVFSSYMVYEANIEKKATAIEELAGYKFVDIDDLKVGEYVRYFNLRNFFDLKLCRGGNVLDIDFENSGDILLCAPNGLKRIKPNIFFTRIKAEELIRMKLLQIAHSI
jgi:hypothetical protein